MQDGPDTATDQEIALPSTAGIDDAAAPADPFAPPSAVTTVAAQTSPAPEPASVATADWGGNILLLVTFALLVAIALLGFRVVRMREDLVFAREQRAASEAEAKQLRHLLKRSEAAAEIRVRHRVAQLLQRTQSVEREREALEQINARLRRLVKLDELTGIANVQELGHALDEELRRALRSKRPVTLIICDVDGFRRYNRMHGHDRGDDLLKRIAHLTQSVFRRGGDQIGRIAGDRFAVIAAETDYDSAIKRAESLRMRVWDSAIAFPENEGPGRVTVSLGVTSIVPDRAVKPYQVFERGVLALQLAKKRGGNLVRGDRPEGRHGAPARPIPTPAGEIAARAATGNAVRLVEDDQAKPDDSG